MLNTREVLNYHGNKYENICLLAYDLVYPRGYVSIFLCVRSASCTSALIMNMGDSSETYVSSYLPSYTVTSPASFNDIPSILNFTKIR